MKRKIISVTLKIMSQLFYGIVIPSEPYIKQAILDELRKSGTDMGEITEANLYMSFFEHLNEQQPFDAEDWEIIQEDPLKALKTDYSGEFSIDDLTADLLQNGEYVFIGDRFTPKDGNGLYPAKKQVPKDVKKQVKKMLALYEFTSYLEPEVLILGNRNHDIDGSVRAHKRQPKKL